MKHMASGAAECFNRNVLQLLLLPSVVLGILGRQKDALRNGPPRWDIGVVYISLL